MATPRGLIGALDGARRRLDGPQIADVLVAFPLGDVCVVAM